jgi:hypothetical protein
MHSAQQYQMKVNDFCFVLDRKQNKRNDAATTMLLPSAATLQKNLHPNLTGCQPRIATKSSPSGAKNDAPTLLRKRRALLAAQTLQHEGQIWSQRAVCSLAIYHQPRAMQKRALQTKRPTQHVP